MIDFSLLESRIKKDQMSFITDTLVQWLVNPDGASADFGEEFIDLFVEYFKDIADLLTAHDCLDPFDLKNKCAGGLSASEHLGQYFLSELKLMSENDLVTLCSDLQDLRHGGSSIRF